MIIATAGHIDHGKTALIKALTGVDADRLPEEKKRGITVDLGFAYQRAENGASLGFVDVPGHEKLVRTMVAGAIGVDFVMLVIAADDGIMPQTREHLAILDLLGIRRGAVVITKIDKVSENRLDGVLAETHALVDGTFLAGGPILPVSAQRGDGIGELKAMLGEAAADAGPREGAGHFRLAVDRAFTLAGTGLVVTGTVHAGHVAVGERLLLAPRGREVRVRGLRAQNEAAESGGAGQRCALNITGARVEKADVSRGDWIVAPDIAEPTSRADVRLRLLPTETRALRHWTPVHVHIGAADIPGRVALLEGASLAPGAGALGQIVLDQPTLALTGDRFVLRDQSARRTIGGGRVIDPRPPSRNARKPERLAFLNALDEVDDSVALDALIAAAPNGVDRDHLAFARNLEPTTLSTLCAARDIVEAPVAKGALLFSRGRWDEIQSGVIAALEAYQEKNPDSFGATTGEVSRTVAPAGRAALAAALEQLIAEKTVTRFGQLVHLPGHEVKLSLDEENVWFELALAMRARGLDPPCSSKRSSWRRPRSSRSSKSSAAWAS